MRRAVRLGCGRRSLCVVAVFAASALAVLLAQASDGRTHTVAHPHLAVAAVVDMRALARGRLVPEAPSGEADQEVLEPQEKAEPNVRSTVPSPFDAHLQAPAHMTATPSPYVSASFLAQPDVPPVGSTKTESPPDTNGAVGRTKLMVPLNSNYVIQRKSDGKVLSRVSMTAFWRAVGAHNPFDPRVLYDPYSDRWLAAAADDPLLPSSLVLYGISETGDPEGKWRLYALDADTSNATWADFPTLGFNQSTVAIGLNMFSTGSLNYARGRLIVLDYASLRAGGSGSPTGVTVPGGFALQPALTYSPSEPTLYLVEHLASVSATYRFWALRGKTLALVGGAPKTNPLGPWSTPGPANVLPQQGGRGIDTGDSRVGNAVFRNGHVYYAQTIAMPPGPGVGAGIHTAVQWVELDRSGNFVQGGRIEDPGANPWNRGHSYAFASLAVNARNDVLLGFSEFQSDDFVDAGYAFRADTDPPGTMRAPVTLKDGEGPYEKDSRDARNRWGDYSSTAVDPSDDLSLWTVQEYARIPTGRGDADGRWGTWWGRVGGPALPRPRCVVPPVVGKPLAKAWRRIADGHCRLGAVHRVRAAKKLRGRVVRQAPKAGKRLPRDARVRVAVGR
jgi:hypothetical protein